VPRPVKVFINRLFGTEFRPYIKDKDVEGVRFKFWIGDEQGRDWYDLRCTDPTWPEMGFIKQHMISRGDVVLECGAHHGCTTILLSRWVGSEGHVVAFEPSESNCRIMKKNLRLNRIRNVTVERKAVGASRGTVSINEASNSRVLTSRKGASVSLARLDDYAHLRPTFLKIDVEGFEIEVLKGAQSILLSKPKLAIEIHPDRLAEYGGSPEDIFRLIETESYKFWLHDDPKQERSTSAALAVTTEYQPQTAITKRVQLFCMPLPCV